MRTIANLILACAILTTGSDSLSATGKAGQPVQGKDQPPRPNIVLFLVDDLGWQDTSVAFWEERTPFQDHFRTPNVERLAEQGVRFSSAYSCAVCSPTRTSILTGLNATRHQVTNWTLHADRDQSGKTNRVGPPRDWRKQGWQPDGKTLPQILRSAGYTTIHCGKAHWGARGTAGSDPLNLGFDVNIAGHSAGAPGSYLARDNFGNNPDGSPNPPWGVPGLEKYYGTETHLTDALAAEVGDALTAAAQLDKPFFLYMAPYAVHTPIQAHPRFIEHYRGKKYPGTDISIPNVEAAYASMVEGYDAALGAVLNKLDQLGVAEDTIIIFTSDNGGLSAHARGTTPLGTGRDTHCWPLREGKGSAYEGGIRVPLVVSWVRPNGEREIQKALPIKAGSTSNVPVICEDYYPTICRWAGIDDPTMVPSDNSRPETGGDLYDSLFNERSLKGQDITSCVLGGGPKHGVLVFHYPHVWGPRGAGYQPHTSMRIGNLKFIYFYHAGRFEVYDLAKDIGERNNLADSMDLKSLEVFTHIFVQGLERIGAQMPVRFNENDQLGGGMSARLSTRPQPSTEDRATAAGWTKGGRWLDQHNDINEIATKGEAEVIFLGDSITQSWGGADRNVSAVGSESWDQYFADRKVANFGISGDRVHHVLWRILNGNLDGLQPKVVVILIGTNDLPHSEPDPIARAIAQIVFRIEERRDRTKILLLGILPRGSGRDDPLRRKAVRVNELISQLHDGNKTHYLDVSSQFVLNDGQLNPNLMRDDHLHLKPAGYQALAEAIEPELTRLLAE